MDFLNGNIKTIYFKYLAAAFGSALITSIYSIVDMAMVGQYHGPEGSAALAVVAPVWNIIYSFGLLLGIGGSVLFLSLIHISGCKKIHRRKLCPGGILPHRDGGLYACLPAAPEPGVPPEHGHHFYGLYHAGTHPPGD